MVVFVEQLLLLFIAVLLSIMGFFLHIGVLTFFGGLMLLGLSIMLELGSVFTPIIFVLGVALMLLGLWRSFR